MQEEKQKEEQYRKIAKNTLVLGSAQIIQMMVTLIRAKAIAILLGPFGAGLNSLILSALSVMQQISSVGIYQSGVREMSVVIGTSDSQENSAKFRRCFLRLSLICSTAGVVVMVLFSPLLSFLLFGSYQYTVWLMLVSLALFFMGLQNGYGVIMQATRHLGLLTRATTVGAVAGLLVAVPLFYFVGLHGIVPAIIISYAAFYISYRYFERKIVFVQANECTKSEFIEQGKPVIKLGIMLMLSAIAGTLFAFVLNLVINRIGSTEEVGLYQSAASIITQGMSITNVILASDFFPRLSAVYTDVNQVQNLVKQQTEILFYILAPVSVLIIAFAPFIVWLLLSPQFVLVADMLQIMAFALVFKGFWVMMSYIMLAKGDKKGYFLFDALLGNGTNFILSVVGFYWGGLQGLAVAYCAGALFMVILLWRVTKKRIGITLPTTDLLKGAVFAGYMLLTYFVAIYATGIMYCSLMGLISGLIIVFSIVRLNKKMKFKEWIKK